MVFVDENYHMHRAGPLEVEHDFLESSSDLSLLDHYADPWSRSLNSASDASLNANRDQGRPRLTKPDPTDRRFNAASLNRIGDERSAERYPFGYSVMWR